jgi:glycine cleavage system H protein
VVTFAAISTSAAESDIRMSNIPKDLRYTEDHEYALKTGDPAVVQIGITDYAQGELGDVVYVDLPKAGASFGKRDVFGTIEAVKAVSELYCPLAGTVVEVNSALEQDPALVNRDPYGAGWMIKLRLKNAAELAQLLDGAAYAKHIGE